jgi:hypothetical protein
MTGDFFTVKNLLQLQTMENKRDISSATQHKIGARLHYRTKVITVFDTTCDVSIFRTLIVAPYFQKRWKVF